MTDNDYEQHHGQKADKARVPNHVAIIMDGNGRWANSKGLKRTKGHQSGKEVVRTIVKSCIKSKISTLTLFTFGKENWKRPAAEVRHLFRLFYLVLNREIQSLTKQGVCLKVHGQIEQLPVGLQKAIAQAQHITANNQTLQLNLMLNYSGRWDIEQAIAQSQSNGSVSIDKDFSKHLCLAGSPEPDLFIRTAGVQRLSNFMLWDLAYTELYFTSCYWPDFDEKEFNLAVDFFQGQERRFGLISSQLEHDHA